jgi:CBS domain-containing protein
MNDHDARTPLGDAAIAVKSPDVLQSIGDTAVRDAMRPGLRTCSPRATLLDVARLMASSGVHAIVVWGDEDIDAEGIWGVLSDSDFIAGAADGVTSAESAVGISGARVVRVGADESLAVAVDLMRANGVTHLIVISDRGRPIGILSALDVARAATRARERDVALRVTIRKAEDHGQDG